jgi:hypothetical protein
VNPTNIPDVSWTAHSSVEIIGWIQVVVYLIGLGIAIWGFLRSRKCGYLVIASYFALVVLWLGVWQPLQRAKQERQPKDPNEQMQQQIDSAIRQSAERAAAKDGQPFVLFQRTVYVPDGPILLVIGLWLLAKRETPAA